MARDDELRKVAEDVRALARSLARDFSDAVKQSRDGGHPTGQAVRDGLRGVANQVGRDLRSGLSTPPRPRRSRRGYAPYGFWGPGPWPPPPPGSTATPAPAAGRCAPRPPRAPRPRPPVRHKWDATTLLGMLAVLFGVAWLLGALHAVHVSAEAVVALGLMLLGASLIVTGRTDWSLSRRSWPVWLGAAMIVALAATSTTLGSGNTLHGISFGNEVVASPQAGMVIHGGLGNLTVESSALPSSGTLQVDSVAGDISIPNLPGATAVQVDARLLAGRICVDGRPVAAGPGPSSSTLALDVHELFGEIIIGSPSCAEHP